MLTAVVGKRQKYLSIVKVILHFCILSALFHRNKIVSNNTFRSFAFVFYLITSLREKYLKNNFLIFKTKLLSSKFVHI